MDWTIATTVISGSVVAVAGLFTPFLLAKSQRKGEHAAWLREKRAEVYSDAMAKLGAVPARLGKKPSGEEWTALLHVANRMLLFGSPEIELAFRELIYSLQESTEKADFERLGRQALQVMQLIRSDLGGEPALKLTPITATD